MFQSNQLLYMGVVNLTPNSFSDGGYHLEIENLKSTLNESGFDIFDFGAESTAPMNDAVSAEEEIERFNKTLFSPEILLEKINAKALSFDTYKVEVIEYILSKLGDIKTPIIWNDVSGQLDDKVIELLTKHSNLYYVYCHNLAPRREQTIQHMNFHTEKTSGKFMLEMNRYFFDAYNTFKHHGLDNRVLFDPCFGFSKTYEQNLYLARELKTLVSDFNVPWVIGISRKSFLRKLYQNLMGDLKDVKDTEFLHLSYLKAWSEIGAQTIFRIHDPKVRDVLSSCADY